MSEEVTKKAENKPSKPAKPGLGQRISRWFREMRSELKKVAWPSKKQLINNSSVVMVAVIAVGIAIYLFDLASSELVKLIIRLAA